MAVLQSNGLVAHTWLAAVGKVKLTAPSAAEAFAPDEPRAEDGSVVDVFAPDQGVVPVIMAVVLVGLPRTLRLGGIVSAGGLTFMGSWRRPG